MVGGFLKTSAKGNSQRYRLFFGLSVLITACLFSETLPALDMTPLTRRTKVRSYRSTVSHRQEMQYCFLPAIKSLM